MVDDEVRRFCEEQYPKLVGALGLYTGDAALAEELAQEAVVRIVRDWRRVRLADRPGAYAHRIAMNLANGHVRRRRALQRAQARHGVSPDRHRDPDAADAIAVRAAVAALPRRQREVVVLRHWSGMEIAEIAEVLHLAAGTVRSHLHDARTALRALLDDQEDADVR